MKMKMEIEKLINYSSTEGKIFKDFFQTISINPYLIAIFFTVTNNFFHSYLKRSKQKKSVYLKVIILLIYFKF